MTPPKRAECRQQQCLLELPGATLEQIEKMARRQGITPADLITQIVALEWDRTAVDVFPFRRWTRGSVLARIRERQAEGLSIYSNDVQMTEPALAGGAQRNFGSWGVALDAAGIVLPALLTGSPARGLRRRRIALGLSHRKLAELARVSQGTISCLENEKFNPSVKMLEALAGALNCEPEVLLDP
jgi:DNA-binding XRE family transcriptional regulator